MQPRPNPSLNTDVPRAGAARAAAGRRLAMFVRGPMASIRITSIPPGEAPVAVRSA